MSAILRAWGDSFDVDCFTRGSSLKIDGLYRVGDPARPTIDSDGRKLKRSGFSVIVSEAEFNDYKLQFKEAVLFMSQNADELRRLAQFPGVQSLVIDFGASIYPPGWCSFRFPHQMLHIAGQLGVDLELSVYPTEPEDDSVGDDARQAPDETHEEFVAEKTIAGEQAVAGKPATRPESKSEGGDKPQPEVEWRSRYPESHPDVRPA